MPRIRMLIVVVLILLVALTACNDGDDDDDERDTSEPQVTTEVTPDDDIVAADRVCALTEPQIIPQGTKIWAIEGAEGSSTVDGSTIAAIEINEDLLLIDGVGSEPVAIIVLDDFFHYAGEPDSHGDLVSYEIRNTLQSTALYSDAPQTNDMDGFTVHTWEGDTTTPRPAMHIIEADTQGFLLNTLTQNLSQALALATDQLGVQRIVVNMSFVVVPCETENYNLPAYFDAQLEGATEGEVQRVSLLELIAHNNKDDYETVETIDLNWNTENISQPLAEVVEQGEFDGEVFEHLMASLQAISAENEDYQALQNVVLETEGITPVLFGEGYQGAAVDTLADFNAQEEATVVYVGAAGNISDQDDCLRPASEPWVVCTSGIFADDAGNNQWVNSNDGQVMTIAGFLDIETDAVQDEAFIGTSFAAPITTANIAMVLTQKRVCSPLLAISGSTFPNTTLRDAFANSGPNCVPLKTDTNPIFG